MKASKSSTKEEGEPMRKVSLISNTSSSSYTTSSKKKKGIKKKTSSTWRKKQDGSKICSCCGRNDMIKRDVGSFTQKRHLDYYINESKRRRNR